jgi:ABC-type lipoprotein export system ATPase subunit
MLELVDLVKHYRVGGEEVIRAVDGVSMSVAAGEVVALYGPSGSGKTTLLELIAGLRSADHGTVRLNGTDVFSLTRAESDEYRLKDIGIIGQPQSLTDGWHAIESASLKLWLTKPRTDTRMVIEPLMERLGLGERMFHRSEELSMGERQRVLIAQALSTDPKLVLADEPTGSLDSQRTREILALLREVAKEQGKVVLLASHDPQAAGYADQVYELRDGKLHAYQPDAVVPARRAASGE